MLAIIITGTGLVALLMSPWFLDKVDSLRHDTYAAFNVNPAFKTIADQHRNVAYCGSKSRYQQLDIYVPKSRPAGQTVPAVMYIHGGGWSVGDKSSLMLKRFGTTVVENGMALVSVNYRLAPQNTYPVQNNDVECALDFLRSQGVEYGIDPRGIGLWGDSAGGQLAAMAALDTQHRDMIGAVVEFYGTADLWAQMNRKPTADRRALAYIGSRNQTLADQASPLRTDPAIIAGSAPFLLFHGVNDHTVPYNQSVALAAHLRQAGIDAQLRTVQHADHNFSDDSRPTADQIGQEMTGFFKQQLDRRTTTGWQSRSFEPVLASWQP